GARPPRRARGRGARSAVSRLDPAAGGRGRPLPVRGRCRNRQGGRRTGPDPVRAHPRKQGGSHMRRIRRIIALTAVALSASVASDAMAFTQSHASFCNASKSVVVQLVNTANALSNSATLAQRQAELKTQFTTI